MRIGEQSFSSPSTWTPADAPATTMRVLVVDHDDAMRDRLRSAFAASPDLTICGEAATAEDAFALLADTAPDLILLKSALRGMNGVHVTRAVMLRQPTPVIVTTDPDTDEPDLAFECLRAGALDILRCPPSEPVSAAMLARVAAIARTAHKSTRTLQTIPALPGSLRPADLLVLLAGVGAVGSAVRLLDALSPPPPVPILLLTGMAPALLHDFIVWLDGTLEIGARPADLSARRPLTPGAVQVAGSDSTPSLSLQNGQPVLTGLPALPIPGVSPPGAALDIISDNGFDMLLFSATDTHPQDHVAVLLGHLGTAGAIGILGLRRAGGQTLVESPAFCPFAGSPIAAARMTAADGGGTADELAALLSHLKAVPANGLS